jgi:hypothetical protein
VTRDSRDWCVPFGSFAQGCPMRPERDESGTSMTVGPTDARRHQNTPAPSTLDKDAPEPRPIERLDQGRIVETPMVGGLHHRYTRQAA